MTTPALSALPSALATYLMVHLSSVPHVVLALAVVAAGFAAASVGAKLLATAFRIVLVGGGLLVAWQIFVHAHMAL